MELEASLKKLNEGNHHQNSSGSNNGHGNGHGNGHVSAVVSTHSANSSTCPSEDGGEQCSNIQTITPTTSMVTGAATGSHKNGSPASTATIASANANATINSTPNSSSNNSNNSNNILLNNHSEHGHDNASLCSIASITSDGSASAYCGHVRMYMFPLYVLEVREHWPESGRARKVVDIDTAIDMMASSSRPEFHKVLCEVKDRGYHLKRPCVVGKTPFSTSSEQSDLIPSSHVVI